MERENTFPTMEQDAFEDSEKKIFQQEGLLTLTWALHAMLT